MAYNLVHLEMEEIARQETIARRASASSLPCGFNLCVANSLHDGAHVTSAKVLLGVVLIVRTTPKPKILRALGSSDRGGLDVIEFEGAPGRTAPPVLDT